MLFETGYFLSDVRYSNVSTELLQKHTVDLHYFKINNIKP